MKIKNIIKCLLITLIFASCTPAGTVIPETAAVIPTATASQTPTPPETNTPDATATETVAIFTSRQQEFLDQGYNKLSSLEEGIIYGILDESSVVYMPDGGVKVEGGDRDGYALSSAEVTFFNPETGKFETGRFIIDWSVEDGLGSFFTYPLETGGFGGEPVVLPQWLVKNFRGQYFESNKGLNPFIKLTFKTVAFDDSGMLDSFFSNVFPEFKGEVSYVTIPGIGKVLAVRGGLIEGYPNWEN